MKRPGAELEAYQASDSPGRGPSRSFYYPRFEANLVRWDLSSGIDIENASQAWSPSHQVARRDVSA